ncbi:MAG: restriction endonuclease [Candidatus Aenigmarchaeota archaeon]|nr:restriction endonuclease [Candidatus Aenigmarchaeota archaeon]
MDLEALSALVGKGLSLEEIAGQMDWKEFEGLVGQVFEENGWSVRRNVRFKTRSRFEIDLVAEKSFRALLVDCKHWGIRPGKKYQLKAAVEKQKIRVKEFKKIRSLADFPPNHPKKSPLLVTLWEEDILKVSGVWIVPLFKLNAFLLNAEKYI